MGVQARYFLFPAFVLLGVFTVLLICAGIWIPGGEVVLFLVIGWCPFLLRVGPQIHIRWDLLGSTAVYGFALIVGGHFFLRWLYREMRPPAEQAASSSPATWQWRWTLSGFALIVLMFAAGIATIGVAHQTTWLARSPESIYHSRLWRVERVMCASNLRQIGQGLDLYTSDHHGKYPDDFRSLFLECDVSAEVFTCPSSNDDKATGGTPQEIANNILTPGHCSYIYFGKGLTEPVDPNKVIAVEHATNHELDGMNVLFADGHVDWLDQPAADELMQKLGFKREQGKPDWQPTTRP